VNRVEWVIFHILSVYYCCQALHKSWFTSLRSEPKYSHSKLLFMSLKGSKTTADYLPWDSMQVLVQKLIRKEDNKFALLIAVGAYTGLRISDILRITWTDLLSSDEIEIQEHKTGKMRTIHIHSELREFINIVWNVTELNDAKFIFTNRDRRVYCIQYINRRLKQYNRTYQLGVRFSTHSFRKSFGRRIWSQNNHSEKSLILLSQIFNHSSISITKRYLGIREEEIKDVYLNL
jgi:integrase